MIATFAVGTKVSVEKTRAELDTLLSKYGATARGIVVKDLAGVAQVAFVLRGLPYRLDVPLPKMGNGEPESAPRGWRVWGDLERELWHVKKHEQACRERWRVLLLLVRAKLEAVRLGMSTVEKEFMPDLVLDNGETVYHELGASIQRALAAGMPLSLGDGRGPLMLGVGG